MKDRALRMLSEFRGKLPDLPPERRSECALCRAYTEAAMLCVEGRYADAVAVLVNSTKSKSLSRS